MSNVSVQKENAFIILAVAYNFPVFHFSGVEDGQTVRVPVEAGELFVTFRVGPRLLNSLVLQL